MSFLRDLYFFQGQKYTSFGKNILLRQSASLGHSSTGHPERNILELMQNLSAYIIIGNLIISTFSTLSTQMFEFYYSERNCFTTKVESIASIHYSFNLHIFLHHKHKKWTFHPSRFSCLASISILFLSAFSPPG